MNARTVAGTLLLALASPVAFAGTQQLPEPGILELLAVGAAAAVAIAIRKHRK